MTNRERVYTLARLVIAVLVVSVTCTVTLHAIATVKTPNAVAYNYVLNPGYSTGAITPASNTPIWVMGVQTTNGYRGVGRVAMLQVPGSFLEWTGLESTCYCGPSTITSGFNSATGTHVVYLDWDHFVDIQVVNPDSFQISNSSSNSTGATGTVTLVW